MINNEFLNIKASESIDIAIEKGIQRASAEIKARRSKGRKIIIASIAAVVVGFFTFEITNPALASKLPLVGGVFESIEKNIYFPGNYSEYSTSVNETVESNGVKVTLSEILCDGEGLYVTYKVESEKPFKYTLWGDEPLTMNQLLTREAYNKVSFSDKELDNSGFAGLEGKFIDDNTFVGMERYYLKSLSTEIPDSFDFLVKLTSIGTGALEEGEKDQMINGTWAFKVPVKVDKSISKNININESGDNGFALDSITITPFSVVVTSTGENKNRCNVNVIADGKELGCDSSSIFEDNKQISYFSSLPNDCKKLRIIMWRQKPEKNGDDTIYGEQGKEILMDKTINMD